MTEAQFYILALAVIVTNIALFLVGRKLMRLEERLDRVRFAAYELLAMQDDTVRDLEDTIENVLDVPLRTTHRDERVRRMTLSPQERRDESIQRFETVTAESERKIKEMGL